MDRIQSPIISVIGNLIREVPGTISLGQGVVHYGPPREAIEAIAAALSRPATHQYNDGNGLPALRELIAEKLARENGIDVARGRIYKGGRLGSLVRKDILAACDTIADVWPKI